MPASRLDQVRRGAKALETRHLDRVGVRRRRSSSAKQRHLGTRPKRRSVCREHVVSAIPSALGEVQVGGAVNTVRSAAAQILAAYGDTRALPMTLSRREDASDSPRDAAPSRPRRPCARDRAINWWRSIPASRLRCHAARPASRCTRSVFAIRGRGPGRRDEIMRSSISTSADALRSRPACRSKRARDFRRRRPPARRAGYALLAFRVNDARSAAGRREDRLHTKPDGTRWFRR